MDWDRDRLRVALIAGLRESGFDDQVDAVKAFDAAMNELTELRSNVKSAHAELDGAGIGWNACLFVRIRDLAQREATARMLSD